jgi:hypothetical protein
VSVLNRIDLRLLLDQGNRIVYAESPSCVCDAQAFAGTDYLAAISDVGLRELYRMIVTRVRETGQVLTFRLRCDTPELRRLSFVRFDRAAEAGREGIEVVNGTLEERPHDRRLTLLDPQAPRTDELVTICSWCKQVRLPDGRWVEVEEAMRDLQLFEQPVVPGLSHGMCPVCAEVVRADFARQVAHASGASAQ